MTTPIVSSWKAPDGPGLHFGPVRRVATADAGRCNALIRDKRNIGITGHEFHLPRDARNRPWAWRLTGQRYFRQFEEAQS